MVIKTKTQINKFKEENESLGWQPTGEFQKYGIENIWTCELFKNKTTGKYSLYIITDDDETHIVFEFE